ncbi:MAG: DUF4430 domain-containing protein [Emergencia sp.]
MKKKLFTSLIICLLLCSSVLIMAGCGDKAEETVIVNPIEITLSITYPEKAEMEDISEELFKIEEDSTVLDAIQLYCNVNDMNITVETTGGDVQGIAGVENGDYGSSRIWKYKLNGELCDEPENQQVLKDGDTLEWVYRKK